MGTKLLLLDSLLQEFSRDGCLGDCCVKEGRKKAYSQKSVGLKQ